MARIDARTRALVSVLDELDLTWLANEIRAMATTPQLPIAKVGDLARARSDAAKGRYEREASPIDLEQRGAASYDECLYYLVKRIEDVAGYLQVSHETLRELGPSGIGLSHLDSTGESRMLPVRLVDATASLRRIVDVLRSEPFSE